MRPGQGEGAATLAGVGLACLVLAACATTPSGPGEEETSRAFQAGNRAEQAGDLQGALVEYVTLLGKDPENAEAHYRVARVHNRLGNPQVAAEAYQRALELDSGHAGALEGLGLLLLNQRTYDLSASYLHRALGRDPKRWRAYDALGVIADLRQRHELAQAYFGQALRLQPQRATLLNNLGYSHYLGGDYEQALSLFNQALALDSADEHAWSNVSLVYTRLGEYGRAVRALENIMDAWSAHYSVGYICKLEGKLDVAEQQLETAIRLSPYYYAEAHAALKELREIKLRLGAGRHNPGNP